MKSNSTFAIVVVFLGFVLIGAVIAQVIIHNGFNIVTPSNITPSESSIEWGTFIIGQNMTANHNITLTNNGMLPTKSLWFETTLDPSIGTLTWNLTSPTTINPGETIDVKFDLTLITTTPQTGTFDITIHG